MITPECFDKSFVLVNDNITTYIVINMSDASTPQLNFVTKIFHVDSLVV